MTSGPQPPPSQPRRAQHPIDAARISPPARRQRSRTPSFLLMFASLGIIVLAVILMACWW